MKKDIKTQIKATALILLLTLTTCGQADTETYNFEDGTLQGWINNADGDQYVATDESGVSSHSEGDYLVREEDYAARDSDDPDVKVLTSPAFLLYPDTEIVIWSLGGMGAVSVPEWSNIAEMPEVATNAGFMGAALRRVSDGEYLLFKRRSANSSSDWLSIGWTNDEITAALASDNPAEKYVIDIIDTYAASWGWLAFDDVTIKNTTIVGDNPIAINPEPFNTETGVLMSTSTLSWDVFNTESPTTYDIYFGTDPSGQQWLESDTGLSVAEYSISTALVSDTVYYWRVDVSEADDPNIYTGRLWNFETEKELPQIVANPRNTYASVGESAQFEVIAANPIEGVISYQWYQGTSLEDYAAIDGATSSVLKISSVIEDDFELYYLCRTTNSQGYTDTEPARIIEKTLLAHWNFEDLNEPNSIVAGTPASAIHGEPTIVEGITGNAFLFDGEDDFVYVPESGSYFDGMYKSCSIACWVKSSQMARWIPFVTKHGENNEGWQMRLYSSNETATLTTRGTSYQDGIVAGESVNDGQWHYIVATYDGNYKNMYVDGLQTFSLEVTGSITPSDKAVAIAARITSAEYNYSGLYHGVIDEVKLYNYAMAKHEVAQNYANITGISICPQSSDADLDQNCKVDIIDFAIMASNWLIDYRVYPE